MFYVLLFLIFAIAIINQASKKYIYKNINFYIKFTKDTVEPQEETKLIITLENNKSIPVTFLESFLQVPQGMYVKGLKSSSDNIDIKTDRLFGFQTILMPYQRRIREYKASFKKRGLYVLNNAYLEVGDIIGFNTTHIDIKINENTIVLPKKINYKEVLIPYGSTMGNISVKRFILDDPSMIIGIREYTGFEPQKQIHWPSSIRLNKLMVKNFDYTTDNSVMVVVNVESFKPFYYAIDVENIENCISIARSICEDLHDNKIPYGACVNSQITKSTYDILHYGLTEHHKNQVLKMLGMADYNISMSFEEYLDYIMPISSNYSSFIIITPKIFDEYVSKIINLSRIASKLIVITASDENLNKINSPNIDTFIIGGDFSWTWFILQVL